MSNIACVRVFVPLVTVGSCTSAGAATAKSRSITTGGTGASSTVTFGVEDGAGALAAVFKARAASTTSPAWVSRYGEVEVDHHRRHRGQLDGDIWCGRRRRSACSRLQSARGFYQLLGLDLALERAVAELAEPSRERFARRGEEIEERRPRQPLLLEPQVHELLDFPGDFAQVHQADHAAAALQRMEAAADGRERLEVVGLLAAHRERRLDALQHLGGLFEEDRQELGVDLGPRRGRRRLGPAAGA